MRAVRLSIEAQLDFDQIVETSQSRFGDVAARRYRNLIVATLRRLSENPDQRVARPRPFAPADLRFYHLRHTPRDKLSDVQQPRHVVVYRTDDREVVIVRVLHDAMDLPAQFS